MNRTFALGAANDLSWSTPTEALRALLWDLPAIPAAEAEGKIRQKPTFAILVARRH
jgi:hypothetical protein